MSGIRRELKQKGNVIVVKHYIEDEELRPKTVLEHISTLTNNIKQQEGQIVQLRTNIEKIVERIEVQREDLRKLQKFEDWANNIQDTKVRVLIDEVKNDIIEQVNKEHVMDSALTEEENNKHKFRMYQNKLATHSRLSEEISNQMLMDYVFKSNKLENPF